MDIPHYKADVSSGSATAESVHLIAKGTRCHRRAVDAWFQYLKLVYCTLSVSIELLLGPELVKSLRRRSASGSASLGSSGSDGVYGPPREGG